MDHLRGELAPGAPFFGVLTSRRADSRTLEELMAHLARSIVSGRLPRRVHVSGADEAWRIDGLIDVEEGLTDDGIERITVVAASARAHFVTVTLRTRPQDAVGVAVDEAVASFAVEAA
jgi:hypothetical protein